MARDKFSVILRAILINGKYYATEIEQWYCSCDYYYVYDQYGVN